MYKVLWENVFVLSEFYLFVCPREREREREGSSSGMGAFFLRGFCMGMTSPLGFHVLLEPSKGLSNWFSAPKVLRNLVHQSLF